VKRQRSMNAVQFAPTLAVALLLSACAGTSRTPATAEEAVAALESDVVGSNDTLVAADGTEERLICRSEMRTGTNFRRRTCLSAEEWAARSRAQRSRVEERAYNERVQSGVDEANGVGNTGLGR
jgi:hypothetical protein